MSEAESRSPAARISRREWQRVIAFMLFALALTSLPYLVGWLRADESWRFSGFVFGVEDGYSYLGKMRLGARGLLDFTLFYTPEPHDAIPFVFLPYLLPGWLVGRLVDSSSPALYDALIAVFHGMRIIFSALLIAVLYRFIAAFVRAPGTRLLALALATFGGGFGWLLMLSGQSDWLGSLPAEFFIPEGFSPLIVIGLPHLALARAALLGGLLLILRAAAPAAGPLIERRRVLLSLGAALCWWVVGLAVPFYLAILYCILAAWGLAWWLRGGLGRAQFPARLALYGGIAAALTLPAFAYFAAAFSLNPAFAQWSAQNLLPSPHPLHYLLAYSVLGIPALWGARYAWRRANDGRGALLCGWLIVVPVLVYLPINVQRRMAEAVIVPLAILAAWGTAALARKLRPRLRRPARAAVIGLASLSSLMIVVGLTAAALAQNKPIHRPAAELRALEWLNASAPADSIVLASMATGNILPAYTHLRPFVGHGPETLDAVPKSLEVGRFMRGLLTPDEEAELLTVDCVPARSDCSARVTYIFYGPAERALARDLTPPEWLTRFEQVYDVDGYAIYRVP